MGLTTKRRDLLTLTAPVTRAEAIEFAGIAINNPDQLSDHAPNHWGIKWQRAHDKFTTFMRTGVPQWAIFVEGNSKLKFWQFSTLPQISCPGAGDCLKWCYSFKAWRFADAYFRQLQNTILVLRKSKYIRQAFMALPADVTVRLYVDGDIDSIETLEFWFGLMSDRIDLQCYGYSKSWAIFLAYSKTRKAWPKNYMLHLSAGSLYPGHVRAQMEALPIVRGEFVAVKAPFKMPNRRDTPAIWAQWARAIKESARKLGYAKSFVCPGKCYDCLPNDGHACGSWKFKNIPVVIGIH